MADATTDAHALVEDSIRKLGLDPGKARVPGATGRWVLQRGSARIGIAVHPAEGSREGSLRVAAPVVKVPDEAKRLALFTHLLELNAAELVGAAFGVAGGDVVVVAERALRDLDASEVDAAIRGVGRIADTWDDTLASRFGAPRVSG